MKYLRYKYPLTKQLHDELIQHPRLTSVASFAPPLDEEVDRPDKGIILINDESGSGIMVEDGDWIVIHGRKIEVVPEAQRLHNLETSLRIALSAAGAAHNASCHEIRLTVQKIVGSRQWSREELEEGAERARKMVATWPQWKKDFTRQHLNQPFVEEPDRGVDGNARW